MAIYYDATEDVGFIKVPEGTYPAHIFKVTVVENKPTKSGVANIYTLWYKLASQCSAIKVEIDGEAKSCSFAVGKKFKDKGIFLFTSKTESGKNRRYLEVLKTLGLEIESEIKTDAEGKERTVQVLSCLKEKSTDIIGLPVLVNLVEESWNDKNTGEKRSTTKVKDIKPWTDGETLSSDELSNDDLDFDLPD